MLRTVPIIVTDELDELSTEALLGRLAGLRALEDTGSRSAWSEDEVAAVNGIAFTDDPAWRPAFDAVKSVLSRRENLPSSADRKRSRHNRAARNRTTERRAGR